MKKSSLIYITFITVLISACGGGGGDAATPTPMRTSTAAPELVIAAAVGTISISWDIPTLREDNTSLLTANEIGGYKIYISNNDNFIPSIPYIIINDKNISDRIIYNLPKGTYYLYITTFDTNGEESKYSSPITRTL